MTTKKAFSLIELLVVLAIIALIATISYPAYTSHLITTHRGQAKVIILDLAARLEQYYTLNNSYQGATLAELGMNVEDKHYQFKLQTSENTFQISALPVGLQAKDPCGSLTYTELGKKGISGIAPIDDCW